jgi:hypothetical protein
MNAIIERVVNSENLGARITENGALDQKMWAIEAFRGKMVFSVVFWGNSGIFEWLEGLGAKDRNPSEVWEFFRNFCAFLECLEWVRTLL